jgi:uncharacterized membrane protein YphA (DoxX/SURF4 family)
LVLRLALATIFIYHGVNKIAPADNQWGAAWANTFWSSQAKPPEDLLVKISSMKPETQARMKISADDLREIYAATTPPIPSTLEDHLVQFAVAWGEFLGGVALLVGFLTRLAAVGLILIQIGAVYMVTASRGFSFAAGGGYEYNFALLAMCLAVVISGSGFIAIDRMLHRRKKAAVQHKELAATV